MQKNNLIYYKANTLMKVKKFNEEQNTWNERSHQSNASLNRYYFRSSMKWLTYPACLMFNGREFHSIGALIEKALSP